VKDLHWYQRLHWRAFLTFLVALVVVSIPTWLLVQAADPADPSRTVNRALGAATLAAIAAAAITALAARAYFTRRIDAAQRLMQGAVSGERGISAMRDEVNEFAHAMSERDEVNEFAHAISEEVSALRENMVRLEQEKRRLSALLEGMGEAVLMIDDAERVLLANPIAEKLLRLPKSYVGERLADVCEVDGVLSLAAEVLWSAEETTEEIDITGKRGETRHVSVSVSPIATGDRVAGAVVLLYDVTRLRRLERVRRDFVANVSHELRTPIAAIQSAAETLLLADLDVDDVVLDFLKTIERNAERMASIVEDLLVLSRLEAAGEEIALHEVDMAPVLAELFDRCDPLARKNGVKFELDVQEDLPTIFAEAGAIRQILQNLVENGIKYTSEGGEVRVVARKQSRKRILIEIADTGVGIPTEHLPRIFERFYRVDVGRSREVGGTGLGLAIVKHLVRKMKGRITVESEQGKGTLFKLSLRIYRPEKQQ
jgi:two-component system phosphate regulon sensor histidine kinase PhoR